jgi:hypothetical protein
MRDPMRRPGHAVERVPGLDEVLSGGPLTVGVETR